MEKIQRSVRLDAPAEKVWRVLLDDETYRIWTAEFTEGSYAVTDWAEGSKVLFLAPDGNGMVSRVVKHVPNQLISFEHLGVIKDGVEDRDSEEVKKWAGVRETYVVREVDNTSELSIDMDVAEDEKEMFEEMWGRALAKVKELAEA